MAAAPLKDDEEVPKKPDIEEFITQLLKSEKFEQLADKIAEKAADKIVSLQHSPKYADRARDDVIPQPTITTIKKTKNNKDKKKEKEDESDNETQENEDDKKSSKEDKSDLDDQEDLSEKPKIDPIAAIKKISEFPVADLSLNFKHFTTREHLKTSKSTSGYKKEKIKEDKNEKSQRKQTSNTKLDDVYEVLQRAQPFHQSESQAESGDKKESEESDDSTDDEKDRKLSASKETEINSKNKIIYEMQEDKKGESESSKSEEKKIGDKTKVQKIQGIKRDESESSESQNDTSTSESNEKELKSKASLLQHKTLENSIISEEKAVKKNNSARSDVGTTNSPSLKEKLISTVAFGYADTENSQESDENKVSNIVDSGKVNSDSLKTIRSKAQNDESEKKEEGQDLDDKSEDDDDDEKTDDDKKNYNIDSKKKDVNDNKTQDEVKIDTKKIRESKGKLYAFAQSPDYEEYHELVANLLKSVKNKDTKRNTVNKDLLDLMN